MIAADPLPPAAVPAAVQHGLLLFACRCMHCLCTACALLAIPTPAVLLLAAVHPFSAYYSICAHKCALALRRQVYGCPIGGTIVREPWATDGSGSTFLWGFLDSEHK